jgi:hypothetical protein
MNERTPMNRHMPWRFWRHSEMGLMWGPIPWLLFFLVAEVVVLFVAYIILGI